MLVYSLVSSCRISTCWGGSKMATQLTVVDVERACDRTPPSMYINVTRCHFFAGAFPSSQVQSNPIKAIEKHLWRNGNEVFAPIAPCVSDETKPTREPLAASQIRQPGIASPLVCEAASGPQHRRYKPRFDARRGTGEVLGGVFCVKSLPNFTRTPAAAQKRTLTPGKPATPSKRRLIS